MAQRIESHNDSLILAGDVGGTNTTIGLIELKDGMFILRNKRTFASQRIEGIEQAVHEALPAFAQDIGDRSIAGCCIAAAGPVVRNFCHLTNVTWDIDGAALEKRLGMPVFIINDLSGICYGIPLLDPSNDKELVRIAHPDGTFPDAQELYPGTDVKAVIAPGTGLGIGYLVHNRGNYLALPAEAGHIDWAAFSDETRELQSYVYRKTGQIPGVEQFVSGLGLENLLSFFVDVRKVEKTEAIGEILSAPQGTRGGLIAKYAESDPSCAAIMDLFIRMFARFASGVALWILPKGGLYLAGGIPAKNLGRIMANHTFMSLFLKNYVAGMEDQLKQIPVYVALDYGINLYGAAHGFHCLTNMQKVLV